MTKEDKQASQKDIMARWRDGEVGCCRLPRLKLRRMAFVLVSVIAFCGSVAEASIPLTVKCQLDRANAQTDIGGKSDFLWVFVLDHSSSMGPSSGRDATSVKTGRRVTRWAALKDGFEETMRSIPNGSKVQIHCVGGVRRGRWGNDGWSSSKSKCIYADPVEIRTVADRDKLVSEIASWGAPTGGTLLYDALFYACENVQNFVRAGGSACVVVFSDGHDEFHSSDCKTLLESDD